MIVCRMRISLDILQPFCFFPSKVTLLMMCVYCTVLHCVRFGSILYYYYSLLDFDKHNLIVWAVYIVVAKFVMISASLDKILCFVLVEPDVVEKSGTISERFALISICLTMILF